MSLIASLLTTLLACAALVACGSDDGANPEQPDREVAAAEDQLLAAVDLAEVRRAAEEISRECEKASTESVRTLAELVREKPEAVYEPATVEEAKSLRTLGEIKRDELRACGATKKAEILDAALDEQP